MPWTESTAMEQKREFIARLNAHDAPFAHLCRAFGISRTTGYKWRRRYAQHGEDGLKERSCRPGACPHQTPEHLQERVLAVRDVHPAWGGRKIHWALKRQGVPGVPAPSTITEILRRNERLTDAPPQRATRRFEKAYPNELWQADFKGHYATTLAGRCHPLTVTDDHSRFNILLYACPGERCEPVQAGLTQAFRTYGMPVAIQFDNGPPWGSIQQAQPVLTATTLWLNRLGVAVLFIAPYHPQSNGKAERFHRTLKRELIQGRTFVDLPHCQREFDRWRREYNLYRPHEALDYAVPASRYQPSPRCFPETLPPVEYDSDLAVRRVNQKGQISFQGRTYRVGKCARGQRVGLKATDVEGEYSVYYCRQKIGTIRLK